MSDLFPKSHRAGGATSRLEIHSLSDPIRQASAAGAGIAAGKNDAQIRRDCSGIDSCGTGYSGGVLRKKKDIPNGW